VRVTEQVEGSVRACCLRTLMDRYSEVGAEDTAELGMFLTQMPRLMADYVETTHLLVHR